VEFEIFEAKQFVEVEVIQVKKRDDARSDNIGIQLTNDLGSSLLTFEHPTQQLRSRPSSRHTLDASIQRGYCQ